MVSLPYSVRDEGTRACEREAVSLHANTALNHIQAIAQANDEAPIPLGTFEDARSFFGGGASPKTGAPGRAIGGVVVALGLFMAARAARRG